MLLDDSGYLNLIYKATEMYGKPRKLKQCALWVLTHEFSKSLFTKPPTILFSHFQQKSTTAVLLKNIIKI